ncbi:MAG: DUF4345 domain-containing protein [Zavarzinia sp.]|nr:DUF4345 domain-containing protein [Zavarzinia sp.]
MKILRNVVRVFCLLPFVTGAMDLAIGASSLSKIDSPLGAEVLSDPVLDSQVRFFGAIWLGYGLSLWLAAGEMDKRPGGFRLLMAILFLSGIGRAVSALSVGLPSAPLVGGMALELVGVPLLLAWHYIGLKRA